MSHKKILYSGIAIILLLAGFGGTHHYYKSEAQVTHHQLQLHMNYHISSADQVDMKDAHVNAPLYSNPTKPNLHRINTIKNIKRTYHLKTNNVRINRKALAKNKPTFLQVSQFGHNYGWIKANQLYSTNTYMLPYTYISQFWPSPAKDACEIASLKTAMTTQDKAMNVPLSTMVSRIPLSHNPDTGYSGNPYHYGTHATIYPKAMVQVAHQYHAPAKDISHASINKLIFEITHGKAVVYEGPFMMKRPGSDHDLTILGYKPGYFFVVDPFSQSRQYKRATWVSTGRFSKLYNSKSRMQHAMTIG